MNPLSEALENIKNSIIKLNGDLDIDKLVFMIYNIQKELKSHGNKIQELENKG
jgi:hypothetical protein